MEIKKEFENIIEIKSQLTPEGYIKYLEEIIKILLDYNRKMRVLK